MDSLVQALVSSCTCKSTCERTYPVPQHLSTPTHQMVRFESLGIEDPDGSIHAHLQPFGTGELLNFLRLVQILCNPCEKSVLLVPAVCVQLTNT